MNKNKNLTKAKKEKNDEFYTQYADIEKEMRAYLDFNTDVFRNKTVLLPCDDPEWSNFTKYFAENFTSLGLRKLVSTCYSKTNRGKQCVVLANTQQSKLEWSYLEGDGDFRSEEVKKLRDEADIIITNPPFSLFRDFLVWIVAAQKQFVIIGNMNAITYKEVFPLIQHNKLWLGNGFHAGNAYFSTPFTKDYAQGVYDSETGLVKFRNALWFTNLDHGRRHQPLALMSLKENQRFNKKVKGSDTAYLKYDNYDAIEVPFTDSIPSDYKGVMGVPISFLDKYCPEQFEIVSSNDIRLSPNLPFKEHGLIKDKDGSVNGKTTYVRIVIKHKNPTNNLLTTDT